MRTKRPVIFSFSVYEVESLIILVFSLIYLPWRKPVCVSDVTVI